MPTHVYHGNPEAFHIIWDWFQPQEDRYLLYFKGEKLFDIPGELPEQRKRLCALCDWLNKFLIVSAEETDEQPMTPEGITNVTLHRVFGMERQQHEYTPQAWIACIQGAYGTYYLDIPKTMGPNGLQDFITDAYATLTRKETS